MLQPWNIGSRSVGTLFAIALVISACGAATPSTASPSTAASVSAVPAASAAKLEKTSINVGNPRLVSTSAIYVAADLGYFNDEGLTVKLVDIGSSAESVPAMESGSLDISHLPYVSILQANEAGFSFLSIATNNASPDKAPHGTAVVARSGDAAIKTLKDLEGKRVGVPAIKSLGWIITAAAIRKAGGDYKKVTFVELPNDKEIDALTNGLIDGAQISEPFTAVALQSGKAKLLSYPNIDVAPGADNGAYATSRKFAEANPNTVAAFVRALKRAHAYLTQDLVRARDLVGKLSKTAPEVMKDVVLPIWPQSVKLDSLQVVVDLAFEFDLIKKKTPVSDILWRTAF